MKRLYTLLVFSAGFLSHSQSLELTTGALFNQFFNYTHSEYNPVYGSGGGLCLSALVDFPREKSILAFELNATHYTGYFKTGTYGFSGGSSQKANVQNTSIGLVFYPMNLKLFNNHFFIRCGIESAFVIHSFMGGNSSWKNISGGSGAGELSPREGHKVIASFKAGIAYPINVNEHWSILPKINYTLGLTSDYYYDQRVRKMLTSLEIGIRRSL